MTDSFEKEILSCWQLNAAPWIDAIAGGEIASRTQCTDRAIVDAVLSLEPGSVLDVGCGEGWLCRALQQQGVVTEGVDATAELVDTARSLGDGEFSVCGYEDIASCLSGKRFDTVVCNFSLLGRESVERLFQSIPALLKDGGHLVVQTLHPLLACAGQEYRDQWLPGSWQGFSERFTQPAPWYFRTIGSWIRLFTEHHFALQDLREPLHPQTNVPASAIFVGQLKSASP